MFSCSSLYFWINYYAVITYNDWSPFLRNLARVSALRQQVLPVSFILRCESCLARVRPDPIWSALPPPPLPPKLHTCLLIISNAPIRDNGCKQASEQAMLLSVMEKKSNDKSYVAAVYDVALNSGLWYNHLEIATQIRQCLPYS